MDVRHLIPTALLAVLLSVAPAFAGQSAWHVDSDSDSGGVSTTASGRTEGDEQRLLSARSRDGAWGLGLSCQWGRRGYQSKMMLVALSEHPRDQMADRGGEAELRLSAGTKTFGVPVRIVGDRATGALSGDWEAGAIIDILAPAKTASIELALPGAPSLRAWFDLRGVTAAARKWQVKCAEGVGR